MLVDARRGGSRIKRLPPACRPHSIELAYAIQREAGKSLGRIGGWKVGRSSGLINPVYAPLFASDIFKSHARLPASRFAAARMEMELAFCLRNDLPPRKEPYSYEEISSVLDLLPLVEILLSRYEDAAQLPLPESLADCLSNGAVVLGEPLSNWGDLELRSCALELQVDGAQIYANDKVELTGDPVELVHWQANHLAQTGTGLKQGDVVTTGALFAPCAAGRSNIARWRGIGEISFRIE